MLSPLKFELHHVSCYEYSIITPVHPVLQKGGNDDGNRRVQWMEK